MKRFFIPAMLVVALVLFAIWWFSPTQVLKRRTESLLTTLTLDGGSGKVGRQMRVYSLNALLASQVELKNVTIKEANGSFERAELESAFSWLCEQAKQTRFKAKNFSFIAISGNMAQVTLTLDGVVELPTYRPADGIYDVTFDWEKAEDGWRLTRANWREAE
jgi:endoglucanase Acf2